MPPRHLVARERHVALTAPSVAGRVKVDGPGWMWIAGAGGAVHVTGQCGPRGPRTVVVDDVPRIDLGTPVTIDLVTADVAGRMPPPEPGPRDLTLALCGLLRPHLWNDPATLALAREPFAGVLPRIIGRGPGLTPAADDAVCGYLAARFVVSPPAAARDAALVAGHLDRTTEPSRSLLRAAADHGAAYAAAEAVLGVLVSGDGTAIAPALRGLLELGRTTGRAILTGLVCGLTAAPGTTDR